MLKDKILYNKLLNLKSYAPSKKVNKLFTSLVYFSLNIENKVFLNKNEIKKLNKVCSKAEFEMEIFWANKIIKSDNPWKTLEKFWYYENYIKLLNLEIPYILKNKNNIIFVGSGPLPITALILVKKYNFNITILEKNKKALNISKKLINKLCLENNFNFIKKDIFKFDKISDFKIIFLAALIDGKKENLINSLSEKLNKNSIIIARSSYDNRVLLYSPIDYNKVDKIKLIKEIKTYDEVVNSVLVFKK